LRFYSEWALGRQLQLLRSTFSPIWHRKSATCDETPVACDFMWGWPLAVAHRTRRGAFWAACTYMRVWIGPHESSSVSFWLSALCSSRGTDFEYCLAEGEKRQASWIAQTKNRRRSSPLPPSMRKLQNTGSMTLLEFFFYGIGIFIYFLSTFF
jgi:hypothetical protein